MIAPCFHRRAWEEYGPQFLGVAGFSRTTLQLIMTSTGCVWHDFSELFLNNKLAYHRLLSRDSSCVVCHQMHYCVPLWPQSPHARPPLNLH